jgi:hypothetical protein
MLLELLNVCLAGGTFDIVGDELILPRRVMFSEMERRYRRIARTFRSSIFIRVIENLLTTRKILFMVTAVTTSNSMF